MAVSESTILVASGTSESLTVTWTSISSGENNTYIDANGVDGSKMVLLVINTNATDIETSGGNFYIGASDTSDAGTSGGAAFSARSLGVMHIKATEDSGDTDTIIPDNGAMQLSVFGPFETARFKDTAGKIHICKGKSTADITFNYVAPLFIP